MEDTAFGVIGLLSGWNRFFGLMKTGTPFECPRSLAFCWAGWLGSKPTPFFKYHISPLSLMTGGDRFELTGDLFHLIFEVEFLFLQNCFFD